MHKYPERWEDLFKDDPMEELEIALIYDWLGIYDDQSRSTINSAIPIAAKMLGHIDDNKQLMATLLADGQLLVPALRIVFEKLAAKIKTS